MVARQSLVLSNAETIQILGIELPDDGADIASGVIPRTGEGAGFSGHIKSHRRRRIGNALIDIDIGILGMIYGE